MVVRKDKIMSLVLTGVVNGMRPVGGVVQQGERKGETWQFLSLEIVDAKYGNVYSCQLRDKDAQFGEIVVDGKLKQDFTGHKVKVTIRNLSASERAIVDKNTGESRVVLQIRAQVTNVRDLGIPDDED
jgi:hypothetical protein